MEVHAGPGGGFRGISPREEKMCLKTHDFSKKKLGNKMRQNRKIEVKIKKKFSA
jgi:hypothetical protein